MTIRHTAGTLGSPANRWRQLTRALSLAALGLIAFTAACSKKAEDARCVDDDKRCGIACNHSHPCASGLYCSAEQLCAKSCTQDQDCGSREHCSRDGECLAGTVFSAAGGQGGQGGQGASGQSSQGGSGGVKPPASPAGGGFVIDAGAKQRDAAISGSCQAADVAAARVIPNIVLVIDQSGSMTENFGNAGSRWNVLRDFLLKPDGLIAMFETQVRFGLAMYSAVEAQNGMAQPPCPMVTSVAPKLMNYADISDAYKAAMPIGETPTGDSIDQIVDGLPKAQLDKDDGPTVLILATDGEPDRCEELNPQNGQAEAVAAVMRAFSMGIRTYIISVGNDVSAQHQQDVANAGVGHQASDPAPYWRAGDDASLRQALTEIIGAQVSCEVALQGKVQSGDPCLGTVELNGSKLGCKDKDGWELADADHIRLLGKACSDWKTLRNAALHARFPCDVQVIF